MANISLIEAVRFYINKMIDDCGECMKALVMDKETTSIVSMAFTQSDILQKEVFLFERIDVTAAKSLKHLTAICFLRPTEENFQALIRELHTPKYGSYFIYFTNFIEMETVKSLAEADEFECIRRIEELYADYLVVNPHLYTLNLPLIYQKNYDWNNTYLQRTVEGLNSLLLSLQTKSVTIRYQKSSNMAKSLADISASILRRKTNLITTNINDGNQTIVLILDRREDAVTPLLNQWTYQAMVHELIGIKNNRVNLSLVPGITKELEDVVMNAEYDEFYANNLYVNFGEIAVSIKELMQQYQGKHESHSKLDSIADMKTFVSNYPEFKKLSGTVSKHVTIVSELSRLVGLYHLLEVSEIEQNLVCQNTHSETVQKIKQLIKDSKVRNEDILRLLCLYALRYERHSGNELNTMKIEAQKHRQFPQKYLHFIDIILDYGGQKFRQADLFNTQSALAITRQFMRGMKGVENVYTQHIPLVKDLLEQLLRGKLKDTLYPNIISTDQTIHNNRHTTNQQNQLHQQGQLIKPNEIIVYIIGGITYEESCHIHMMNKHGARILIGGSYIHNFSSFMDEVLAGAPSNLTNASNELLSSKRR